MKPVSHRLTPRLRLLELAPTPSNSLKLRAENWSELAEAKLLVWRPSVCLARTKGIARRVRIGQLPREISEWHGRPSCCASQRRAPGARVCEPPRRASRGNRTLFLAIVLIQGCRALVCS